MKISLFSLISVAFLSIFSLPCAAQKAREPLSVMSFNIRNSLEKDGTNSWEHRYPATGIMVDDQKPDVLCLQEALANQNNYLVNVLTGYKYVGVGAEDGKKDGEYTTIFYRTKTVSVAKWGTFWISDNPEAPSDSWDPDQRLCATWAVMKDKKSGNRFFLLNVRLAGEKTVENGLPLVLSKLDELNKDGLPVVLAGDFNLEYLSACLLPLRSAMSNAREVASRTDDVPSFNGWGKKSGTIDHIWFSRFSSCVSFETVTKPYFERNFISDHYPVKAALIF